MDPIGSDDYTHFFERITDETVVLRRNIQLLRERLIIVLSPEAPLAEPDIAERQPVSPIGNALKERADALHFLNTEMADIINRLQIP